VGLNAKGYFVRIATITNFAYVATVILTLSSGVALFMASGADRVERRAVEQRYTFDEATEALENEVFSLSELARTVVINQQAEDIQALKAGFSKEASMEKHLTTLKDVGATTEELMLLRDGITLMDTLRAEQQAALKAVEEQRAADGVRILFGAQYEDQLTQAEYRFEHFRNLLDKRVQSAITEATKDSQRLRTLSEIMVALTALLFLFVLGFIIKHRILRPVVTLSDVVNRLASQDYAVEAPVLGQVDEIGDMAQAIRIFRENGLARQRLERERDADWVTRNLLARMTQRLQGCDTRDSILKVIALFVPQIVPDMSGRLYMLDRHANRMVCMTSWLSPEGDETPFAPECCWALKRGQLHSPGKDAVDIPCEHLDPARASRATCVPLIAQNNIIGLLSVENRVPEKEPPYTYLELIAETLALALANQQLRDTLTERAMFDSLTGLHNRHHLDETLRTLLARTEAKKSVLSCLMIDIDYFKRLNDAWGHEAGDKAIRETALCLQNTLRERGVAFRYGGEEFLVLLPDVNEEEAITLGSEIMQAIAAQPLIYEAQDIGPLSVSIGVATWPVHARADNLIRSADLALYLAKERGRGQIVVAKKMVKELG